MKRGLIIFFLFSMGHFQLIGQSILSNKQRIYLGNQVEILINQLQKNRPDQNSVTRELNAFSSSFRGDITDLPNFIYPGILVDSLRDSTSLSQYYCQQNFEVEALYRQAYDFLKERDGIYEEFSSDVGKASLPSRTDSVPGQSHVDFFIKTNYQFSEVLYSEIKSRAWISYSSYEDSIADVKISNIELRTTDFYYLRRRPMDFEFALSPFSNLERVQFQLFNDQVFKGPLNANQFGVSISLMSNILQKKTGANSRLKSGFEFTYYSQELAVSEYQANYIATDIDNDDFIRTVTGQSIIEKSDLLYLTVPIHYHFNPIEYKRIVPRLFAGISISVPVLFQSSISGTFDYEGYYPQFEFAPQEDVEALQIALETNMSSESLNYSLRRFAIFLDFGIDILRIAKDDKGLFGLGLFIKVPVNNFITQSQDEILTDHSENIAGLNNYTNSSFMTPIGIRFIYQIPKIRKINLKEVCPKK